MKEITKMPILNMLNKSNQEMKKSRLTEFNSADWQFQIISRSETNK